MPDKIWFDANNQAITFWDKNLKLTIPPFKVMVGVEVKDVKINSVEPKWNKYLLNISWSVAGSNQNRDVETTKDEFLSLISPYYAEEKTKYKINLTKNWTTVPINVEVV